MNALSSTESNSPTSIPSTGEIPLAHQAKDATSSIRRHRVLRLRLIINDDNDSGPAVLTKSDGKSRESIGEVCLDKPEDSSVSDKEGGLADDKPPLVRVNRGTMTTERMNELVMRYKVPSRYIFKIPTTSKYVSILGPLEISVCKKSFQAKF